GRITAEGTDTVRSGRDEILAMYRQTTRIHEDTGTPRTKHVTTNLIIDVDDESDTARARSYFTVLQAAPGLDLQPVIAGRYHDRSADDHHVHDRLHDHDRSGTAAPDTRQAVSQRPRVRHGRQRSVVGRPDRRPPEGDAVLLPVDGVRPGQGHLQPGE